MTSYDTPNPRIESLELAKSASSNAVYGRESLPGLVAIDAESTYSDECDISTLGVWHYIMHPDTEVFRWAFVGRDANGEPLVWRGKPQDAPWDRLKGCIILAHNAVFDYQAWERSFLDGHVDWIPDLEHDFADTADLAAYLQAPRNLKGAASALLCKSMAKEVRDMFKNKTVKEITNSVVSVAEDTSEYASLRKLKVEPLFINDGVAVFNMMTLVEAYVLSDAVASYQIWIKYSSSWPRAQREISGVIRRQNRIGVRFDTSYAQVCARALEKALHQLQEAYPEEFWDEKKGTWVVSGQRFKAFCDRNRVAAPKSLAKNKPDLQKWIDQNAGSPIAKVGEALQHRGTVSFLLSDLRALSSRVMADGYVQATFKCMAAATGRLTSGAAGDQDSDKGNFQNMPRLSTYILPDGTVVQDAPWFTGKCKLSEGDFVAEVNKRHMVLPPKGCKWVICDLDQIEPRLHAWAFTRFLYLKLNEMRSSGISAGKDYDALKAKLSINLRTVRGMHEGECAYFLYAREAMGYKGSPAEFKKDPLRQKVKVRVLSLRYGVSAAALNISKKDVNDFRKSDPAADMWDYFELQLEQASKVRGDLVVPFPSGRSRSYFAVEKKIETRFTKSGSYKKTVYQAHHYRGGTVSSTPQYGGKLFNSYIQGTGADVCLGNCLNIEKRTGFLSSLTIHDEVLVAVPDDENLQENAQLVCDAFCEVPEWLEGCPISSSPTIADHYCKTD